MSKDFISLSHTKLLCRHNSCGNEWKITPSNFFRGYGCPKCATDASRKTNTQFLQEVKKLTGDEYTFLESYVNYSTKLLCRHNSCGNEWKITPDSFLHGSRCPKCAGNMKKTPEQFFQEVKKLVGDEYVFLEPYINNSTKLLCRHNACGYEWEVTPGGFLFGRRCPKCAGNMKKTPEQFLQEVKKLVGDEYVFLESYMNNYTRYACMKYRLHPFPVGICNQRDKERMGLSCDIFLVRVRRALRNTVLHKY